MRGIGYAAKRHAVQGAQRFISSSGGNAGLAVAYAGRALDLPVLVVVPETTPQRAIDLLEQENAHVIVHGTSWVEANALAQSKRTDTDAFFHPFDDPLLWEGHASMMDEVVADGLRPDAVILSVGGGGLLSGVHHGLLRNRLTNTPIFALETHGMASYHTALNAGGPVTLDAVSGVATSLGAKQVCQQAYNISQTHDIRSVLVSDKEAVEACFAFLNDHRVLVEPACGVGLAAIYAGKVDLSEFENVLMIVCGGSTTPIETLTQYRTAL
jgi:L-serine/L-threonine ammonia-lyase